MLSAPARYMPYASGRYEVKVGLHRLGTDFGNGAADNRVFQLDTDWPIYRRSKLQARREQFDKYVAGSPSPAVAHALATSMIEQLLFEYPDYFHDEANAEGVALHCLLSSEILHFDQQLKLLRTDADQPLLPTYRDTLDALACQCQEDVCVIEIADDGIGHITALHLCLPNHWSANDKLGSGFVHAHAPVPGMAKINRQADRLLQTIARKGKYVRFAWGLATDCHLNHHPIPPTDQNPDEWRGRHFDSARPALYVRIERQTLVALPPVNALLFTIRTYFEDVAQLEQHLRQQLITAIQSMDSATLAYKGLASQKQAILEVLHSLV